MRKNKGRKIPPRHRREVIVPLCEIVLEILTIAAAMYLQGGGIEKMPRLYALVESLDSSVDALITFSAITSSVVIMFYSLIDAKSFGIPHRTIMYYFLGSFTIPVGFVQQLLTVPFIINAAGNAEDDERQKIFAVIMTIYCLVQQIAIIVMIILSASYTFNIMMITSEERWQYHYRSRLTARDKKYYEAWETSHAMQAMQSDDLFFDRIKLIEKLLDVPLWYARKYHREAYKRNRWNWECNDIYEYYFEQMSGVFDVLNGEDNRKKEREKFYQILYVFLIKLRNDMKLKKLERNPKYRVQYQDLMHVVSGALMNTVVVKNPPEQKGFCNYILNEIFEDEKARNRQIAFYILMICANSYMKNEARMAKLVFVSNGGLTLLVGDLLDGVRDWDKWTLDAEDSEFCSRCWKLLTRNTTVDIENADMFYDWTINAMFACAHENMKTQAEMQRRQGGENRDGFKSA